MAPVRETVFSDGQREVIFDQLKALTGVIRAAVGQDCEVVIHDFRDLENSIIWIEGNLTNRKIGGSLTDLGLAKIRAGEFEDLLNYSTYSDDGRTLRSSSVFLRDPGGNVFGALCINVDITPLLAFDHVLRSLCSRNDSEDVAETFSDDIYEILQNIVEEAAYEIGKPPSLMNRDEKVNLVAALDSKGAFQVVKKAVPFVASRLGVSRYTVYNYLNQARERHENGANSTEES